MTYWVHCNPEQYSLWRARYEVKETVFVPQSKENNNVIVTFYSCIHILKMHEKDAALMETLVVVQLIERR